MKEQKKEKCIIQSFGVTLIALILTIIILLILAVTSVVLVMRWNMLDKTEYAAEGYQGASEREILEVAFGEYAMDSLNNKDAKLIVKEAQSIEGDKTSGWTITFPSGNKYTIDEDGSIRKGQRVQVTVDGKEVTLNKKNVKDYLGKIITNFKTGVEETESIQIGSANYIVSTKYRLYYVDFNNKYGEGEGSIYLKAECTSNKYPLQATDTTESTAENIKIRNLNPELYKAGTTPPDAVNGNMKAVTWLLNIDNWGNLKSTVNETYKDKVKYIVGAPSLEMLMDSYNTHYGLENDGTEPFFGTIQKGERKKLFYKYPYDEYNYGYGVGPGLNSAYDYDSSNNSIQSDSDIDTMYYPSAGLNYYWLGSPAAKGNNCVFDADCDRGGYIYHSNGYSYNYAFCPLVCLEPSVKLTLDQTNDTAE